MGQFYGSYNSIELCRLLHLLYPYQSFFVGSPFFCCAGRQVVVIGIRSAECNFFPQCTEINLCFTSHTCTIIIIIVMVNGATRKTNGWQWRPCCPWYWSFFIILFVVASHRNHPFTRFSSRPVPAHRLSGKSSGTGHR